MKIITDDGQEFKVLHVKMAEIQPGDVLILRHEKQLSDDFYRHIKESFKSILPDVKIAVLEDGMDIEILRQAKP
jgi:hypothetical protein